MIGRQVAIKMMKKRCATNHHANSFQLKEKIERCARKTRSGYIKANINTKSKYARRYKNFE